MADCNRNCCNDCGRERKYPCDTNFREAVCVHTDKIYDSCRDKDCLENVRVYLTSCGQDIVDRAINVKCTKAEVIWVFTDIEAVPFNRGFYSVDLKYFFKVTLAVFTGVGRPTEVEGLATLIKKLYFSVRKVMQKCLSRSIRRTLLTRSFGEKQICRMQW